MIPDNEMRLLRKLRHPSLGLGLRMGFSGGGLFNPAILFANGEQGAWYDPSDLSTVFQDSSGITAGAVGQTVGLILDKSKGLAQGAELVSNGDFSGGVTTGWTGVGGTPATLAVVSGELEVTAPLNAAGAEQILTTVAGRWYKVTGTIRKGTATDVRIRAVNTNASGTTLAESAVVTSTSPTEVSFYFLATSTASAIYLRCASTGTGYFDNISVKHIAGNHRYQTTAASRPILRQSGSLYYLEYDGTDDFLVTNAIDFSASDKIAVFAGVRKLSDAQIGMLVELSATITSNNGAFNIPLSYDGVSNGVGNYGAQSKGTLFAGAYSASQFAAPETAILTMQANIAADTIQMRRNGTQIVSSVVADQGTGNYGNHPVYFGRRGGASLPFNGHEYGVIIRGGASDAAMINLVEAWMNAKTGAY